jgi:hypothetical protein
MRKLNLKFCEIEILTLFCTPDMVDVVQLVRTSDCGSEGRRFEPGLPPKQKRLSRSGSFCFLND